MASRSLPNLTQDLISVGDTSNYLKAALEDIVTNNPPRDHYDRSSLKGLWSGPTGIAYLFLHVSAAQPELLISGQHASTWATSYINAPRADINLPSKGCGIGDERLCYHAVAACITKDNKHIQELMSNIPDPRLTDTWGDLLPPDRYRDYPRELLFGWAGTMYLLRMVRHWIPDSAAIIDDVIFKVTRKIKEGGWDWEWRGKRYLGAVHGKIGIVTQLVLSTPERAADFEFMIRFLLTEQLPDGNWLSSEGSTNASLVQFCHGAPGFVHSLRSLRPHFPSLQQEIDHALGKAEDCIWEKGLLRKEPSLCHGIFGNAL